MNVAELIFPEGRRIPQLIRSVPELRPFAERTLDAAEQFSREFMPECTPALFGIFYKTGSRAEYQAVYFKRRAMLNAFAFAALCGAGEKYVRLFNDALMNICAEHTWALPAHIPENAAPGEVRRTIDLFAAETAFALAELVSVCDELVGMNVKKRVISEIRDRVIEPYMNGTFFWERNEDNWAAVCAGSIGAAALYICTAEENARIIKRTDAALKSYLAGIGEDGSCREGYLYWQYGFGYFTYYAALVRNYTNGRIDYFRVPKVGKCAAFENKVNLHGARAVNFADCAEYVRCRAGLSCFLAREYQRAYVPDLSAAVRFGDDECFRTAEFLRDFAWFSSSAYGERERYALHYLPDAEWFIKKTPLYAFAAKGGTNGEPHNHNDIGGFMLDVLGEIIIADLGAGEYTRGYFGEKRYDIFINSSLSHSVPVINGRAQSAGVGYGAKVLEHEDGRFILDISGAYADESLISAVRTFRLDERHITIIDVFRFSKPINEVHERFISHIDGRELTLRCNGRAEYSSELYSGHDAKKRRAYITDIPYKSSDGIITAIIDIDI